MLREEQKGIEVGVPGNVLVDSWITHVVNFAFLLLDKEQKVVQKVVKH